MKLKAIVPALLALVALAPAARASGGSNTLFSEQVTHNQVGSNAFTDLIVYGTRLFLAYREGSSKVSYDGKIRVLSSTDGVHWSSAALIAGKANEDLRVPHFSIRPKDGMLLLNVNLRNTAGAYLSRVFLSKDGSDWDAPTNVADPGVWLWSIVWNQGKAYSIGAFELGFRQERLYTSTDGTHWTTLVSDLFDQGLPGDADLAFAPDGHCYCVIRRDGDLMNTAVVGVSSAPYTSWAFKDLGVGIASPRLFMRPDGHLFIAGRLVSSPLQTIVAQLNPNQPTLINPVVIDQNDDTGYPGLVPFPGGFLVSYYSGAAGQQSNIFLALINSVW